MREANGSEVFIFPIDGSPYVFASKCRESCLQDPVAFKEAMEDTKAMRIHAVPVRNGEKCEDTCTYRGFGEYNPRLDGLENRIFDMKNGKCRDGGPGSSSASCPLGSDCSDCGPRKVNFTGVLTHTCYKADGRPCDNAIRGPPVKIETNCNGPAILSDGSPNLDCTPTYAGCDSTYYRGCVCGTPRLVGNNICKDDCSTTGNEGYKDSCCGQWGAGTYFACPENGGS